MKQRIPDWAIPVEPPKPPVILESAEDGGPEALMRAIVAAALDILRREIEDERQSQYKKAA